MRLSFSVSKRRLRERGGNYALRRRRKARGTKAAWPPAMHVSPR
jgi:hypothetical protein